MKWTTDSIKTLASLLVKIDEVKQLALKVNLYKNDGEFPVALAVMPEPKLTAEDMPSLLTVATNYLESIPKRLTAYFTPLYVGYFTGKYYNEIPLYEARTFVDQLNSVLKQYESGKFLIDIYDLNDQIHLSFPTEKLAEEFMSIYAEPCTLFEVAEGIAHEINCQ